MLVIFGWSELWLFLCVCVCVCVCVSVCLSFCLSRCFYLPLSSQECHEELTAQGWSPQFTLGCRTGCYQLPFTFDLFLTTIFLVRWLEIQILSKTGGRMLKDIWKSKYLKTLNGPWPVILSVWGWTSSLDVAKFKLRYRGHSAVEPLQMGRIREGLLSSCIAGKGSEAVWLLPHVRPSRQLSLPSPCLCSPSLEAAAPGSCQLNFFSPSASPLKGLFLVVAVSKLSFWLFSRSRIIIIIFLQFCIRSVNSVKEVVVFAWLHLLFFLPHGVSTP